MSKIDLQGLRVLNTRPVEQGQTLSSAIQQAGGVAIACPALAIEALPSLKWGNLNTVQQAIFVSANAVQYAFNRLDVKAWPESIIVIAIGQATAQSLTDRGLRVDYIPQDITSEGLLALPCLQEIKGQSILLIKGEGGRPLIAETLSKRGALLKSIEVYRRVLPSFNAKQAARLWHNDEVDIILFTSQFALHNLFALFGEKAKPWLYSKPCIVLSERLAQCAVDLGINRVIISRPEKIIDALYQFKQGSIHDQ